MSILKISLSGIVIGVFTLPCVYAQEKLFVYPNIQQSAEQQAEDRYDCHQWAVAQSNFDPSKALVIVKKPVRLKVGENKSSGATAKGAIAGAVVGAVIGSRGNDTAEGVAIGGMVGTVVGAAVEQEGKEKAREEAREQARSKAQEHEERIAAQNRQRAEYRRALTSCLEGRNYTVR
ncbi:MAG: hypothetical protein HKN70_06665 [Gammaproteobacteria bacterium]|nr:hypothetical protein [Gammaproteobacteria bacterium]